METKQKSIHGEILEGLKSYRCQHLRDGPDGDGLPLVDVFSMGAPSIKPGIDELEMLADHIWDNITDDAIRREVPTPPQPPVPEAGGQERPRELSTAEIIALAVASTGITEGGIVDDIPLSAWDHLHAERFVRTVRSYGDEYATIGTDRGDKELRRLIARLPSPPPPAEQQTANEYDYPEDSTHENGNYNCWCRMCRVKFIGHKRRLVCRKCSVSAPADQGQAAPQQGGGKDDEKLPPESDAYDRERWHRT